MVRRVLRLLSNTRMNSRRDLSLRPGSATPARRREAPRHHRRSASPCTGHGTRPHLIALVLSHHPWSTKTHGRWSPSLYAGAPQPRSRSAEARNDLPVAHLTRGCAPPLSITDARPLMSQPAIRAGRLDIVVHGRVHDLGVDWMRRGRAPCSIAARRLVEDASAANPPAP